jgi:hypothetical protein
MGFVCLNSVWQDALAHGAQRLMQEYRAGGIYLDTTITPFACSNELHGCGYRRPDGSLAATYPVFAVRETMKRIYAVVKADRADGLVDVHPYDCMNSSALAFATSYWAGEQLRPRSGDLFAEVTLDRFRTEMMGRNWGVPAEFLHYTTQVEYPRAFCIALLHDVPVRPHSPREVAVLCSVRRMLDDFGRREAEWLPYWRNADSVAVSPRTCYASLYRHPKNGVLAVVSNLGGEDANVEVALDARKLGLPPSPAAADALTQEKISVEGNRVRLSLGSLAWKAVRLR